MKSKPQPAQARAPAKPMEFRDARTIGPELVIETDRGVLHVRGADVGVLKAAAAKAEMSQ